VDSNHCISERSRITRVPRRSFMIAGTKDKRAITTQKVTVKHGSMVEFQKRCCGPMSFGQTDQFFEIGDLVQTNSTTFLGNLKGNRFTIVLKCVKKVNENVPLDLSKWCEKGYINYYGAQRFGTAQVGTHQVGVAMINRDYSLAVDLILKLRNGEDERLTEIRQTYVNDGDAQKLLNNLPKRCTAERAVANGLTKDGKKGDLWKVLQLIPRNTLTMYLHALQSLVWNRIASLRIERYGVDKVIGS